MSSSEKGQKKKSQKEDRAADAQAVEKLKAVVLADSFSTEFRPITLEQPRSLLPVVNIPLIEYTIEFLAGSGVQEVLVFTCSHSKLIQEYINNSKWRPGLNIDFSVRCISSHACFSEGDAMREICDHDIRNDFVLVSGDVISTMDLKTAIKEHNERRKKDKTTVMTMVFKKVSPIKRLTNSDSSILAINPDTKQLLQYEQQQSKKELVLPLDAFSQFKSVQVFSDVIDCHIDICSPEVLLLFKDNFDFQSIREDFVKGVLNQEEIYGNHIYTYILTDEYAGRVNSLRAYESVSKEIVRRWSYPIVPDTNFTGSSTYKFLRPNNYLENSVVLSRTCTIGSDTVIGESTEIADNSSINNTIIGRNVKIGKNVKIEGSFLWDNVEVQDDVVITNSLICNNAVIRKGAKLSRGSVISFNVVISEGFVVPEHSRITAAVVNDKEQDEEDDGFDDDNGLEHGMISAEVITNQTDVGKNGKGRIYLHKLAKSEMYKFNFLGVPFSELDKNEEPDSGSDTEEPETSPSLEPDASRQETFAKEVHATVARSLEEDHTIENAILEVNGLKFGFDASFEECASSILSGILEYVDDGKRTIKEILSLFKTKMTTKWKKLLKNFVRIEKEHLEEIELLNSLVDFCSLPNRSKLAEVFQYLVQVLYEAEVCSEGAIFEWAAELEKSTNPTDNKLVKKCESFLAWLREAEEESEEEEDDDEEEEEEEDE